MPDAGRAAARRGGWVGAAMGLGLAAGGPGVAGAQDARAAGENAGGSTVRLGAGLQLAQAGGGIVLPQIDVTAGRGRQSPFGPVEGFAATRAITATKTDTPLLEVPQSIQVVPRSVMDSQAAVTVNDALRNVSGVANTASRRGWDYYVIRGFNATGNTYQDGLFLDRNFWYRSEAFGAERIEVLKGPASVLFGQSPPGGLVNIVSRRPQGRDAFRDLSIVGGSYGFVSPRFDIGGPLDAEGTVSYRLTGLYQRQDDIADFAEQERFFLAPALRWDIGPRTSVTFLGSFARDDKRLYEGAPASGSVLFNPNGRVPRSRNVVEPGFDALRLTHTALGYEFEHRFSDALRVRQNLRGLYQDIEERSITFATGFAADGRTLLRTARRFAPTIGALAVDTSVEGRFSALGAQHTLLAGVDFYGVDQRNSARAGTVGPLDLFAPRYGTPVVLGGYLSRTEQRQRNVGLYVQDQAKIFDRLTFVLGGRVDFTDQETDNLLTGRSTSQDDRAFSPRAGIVYEVVPGMVSLYGSYTESFFPVVGTAFGGLPFDPERGRQYEVGVKAELLDGRLTSTAALYHLTRTNVLTPDPVNRGFSVQTGEQRSRGVEIDVAANPAPGWNLIASYAYTDAEITSDNNPALVGRRPFGVPRHQAALWTTYQIQDGPLRGLGAGLGGRWVGSTAGDNQNSFRLPGYTLLDASVFYDWSRYRFQVNARNLTDERYYTAGFGSPLAVFIGEPLTVFATLGVRF